MALDNLNKHANEKFEELKNRQKLNNLKSTEIKVETIEKVFEQRLSSEPKISITNSIESDEFFSRINALELPPNLSLAVSFILIAAKDSNKKRESLTKALDILMLEANI